MNLDIVFISYDEEEADYNYNDLKKYYPSAKRVHGIDGIREAHKQASIIAQTPFFFTVDGDNRLISDKKIVVPKELKPDSVYVWRCLNPINQLVYGYGGIKLWDKRIFNKNHQLIGDHATNAVKNYIIVDDLLSITHFNTSPFNAWKAGFRESVKLSHNIKNNIDNVSESRLQKWQTKVGEPKYADKVILGVKQGIEHYKNNKAEFSLQVINDYEILYKIYKNTN